MFATQPCAVVGLLVPNRMSGLISPTKRRSAAASGAEKMRCRTSRYPAILPSTMPWRSPVSTLIAVPIRSSPAFAGEGDHAKHGGGGTSAPGEPLHQPSAGRPPPAIRGRIKLRLRARERGQRGSSRRQRRRGGLERRRVRAAASGRLLAARRILAFAAPVPAQRFLDLAD